VEDEPVASGASEGVLAVKAMKRTVLGLSFLFILAGASACGDGARKADGEALQGCSAPTGMGSPSTIPEAIQLINVLAGPVSVPCLVQALDRPLAINATSGLVSAQPAVDEQSPRVFIFLDGLILSIVPAGRGRDLLELGQYFGTQESLKGELNMPVEPPIEETLPYDHLRYNDQVTICGLCHLEERPAPEVDHPNAYISRAFQLVEDELVSLEALRGEHETCDADADPERCAILSALFDYGPVEHQDFPEEMLTIYDF
jgi:hypothetical protein